MLNRTIGRLCGFFFGFWLLSGVPADIWSCPPAGAASPELQATLCSVLRPTPPSPEEQPPRSPQQKEAPTGKKLRHASSPEEKPLAHLHSKKKREPARRRALLSFLSCNFLTQQPSLRLPSRGSILRLSPSSSIPRVCGTGRN